MRIVTNYWVTFCFTTYVFDSHADLCLIPPESIPFKPESESELSTVYYFTPGSESKSISLIQSRNLNRFRHWMTDSGPQCSKVACLPQNARPPMWFLQLRAILQLCPFIHIFDVFQEWKCHEPRYMESKRSRNQSFLVNRNRGRNRFRMAMLCWKRNRNQPQFFLAESESESAPVFLAESESISVSWDQAQVCPTQYEKCETSISFLNMRQFNFSLTFH